ncbi:TPA: cytochrome b/b6 domain-containing protein [Klebsiella pneumoniae]|uniref:cytochrome b/b6 domain-containing protein n=1 Tax=Klebsiella pneumoniae complex TaxID=3390273 RepID=UPI0019109E5A|nr:MULTISPECIES: cytochrome b/b6 domain-containing protein [Klebsiella]MBS3678252.1 cytochrome b/b6 domain-containing protein [Klebsiella quasipneumoniae]MDN7347652.1 cytochrome b/b6 domain-containing protein [Klebsiella quasipneumoniae]
MKLVMSFINYLTSIQTKPVRNLHVAIALLVVFQIINSNGIQNAAFSFIDAWQLKYFFNWLHIFSGFTLLILSVMLVVLCFKNRGFKYFYPYLWGDFQQIKMDLLLLTKRELPDASAKGIAACVQGLGLGALLLVIISGITWFLLWRISSPFAVDILNLHKNLTSLIEIYIVAHGSMGVLHFILSYYKKV